MGRASGLSRETLPRVEATLTFLTPLFIHPFYMEGAQS